MIMLHKLVLHFPHSLYETENKVNKEVRIVLYL